MNLSPMHIAVVVLVIILIFGAPKLPMLARSLGQSLKIFKSEVKDLREDSSQQESKTTEPGELNRESSRPEAQRPQGSETARRENEAQDPQTHEK